MIRQLEKPVFQRASTEEVGAWFQDAMPTDKTENKYYSIFASDTNHLYEYNSRDAFRDNNRATAVYELPFPFTGTGHLVYNGSFYYHEAKSQMVVRFEFSNENSISYASRIVDASYNDENYLYPYELGYMDTMADENGLWVVYSAKGTNNTLVRKLHPFTLSTEYMWNLTLPHRSVGEMFIACGVLYAVDTVTAPSTRIRFAFDLYQNKVLEVDIPLSEPYSSYSMIAYNPKHGKIFTWDKDNQLVYPISFGTIDLEQSKQKEDSK